MGLGLGDCELTKSLQQTSSLLEQSAPGETDGNRWVRLRNPRAWEKK